MKRLTVFFMAVMLLILPLLPTALAAENTERTEYFEDGSYLIEGVAEGEEVDTESADSFIARVIAFIKRIIIMIFKGGAQTTQGVKYVRYYDKNGMLLWEVHLTGEFTFDGKTSSCTGAEISCGIYDSDWKEVFATAERDGARATGSFKISQQKLGVSLKSVERKITLKCDEKGNVK